MNRLVRTTYRPVAAGVAISLAVAAALLASVVLFAALPHDVAQWAYAFVAPALFAVAAVLGGVLDGTDPVAALGLKRAPRPWQAGLIVALAVACIVAFLPLATWIAKLFALMGYHGGPNYADYTSSWGNMILGLVAMALMPAVGEEALCRGMAFGAMRQKGTYFGIVLSAVFFALLHGNPVQVAHQFLIGVVMAVLVHLTRTVWASVIFHFCNNAVVILYEFTYTQCGWTYTIPWWVLLIMFVVGLPSVVLLVWLFGRLTLRKAPPAEGAYVDERPTVGARIRRTLDVHGEYTPFVKGQEMFTVYIALAVVGVVWLANTISGWIAK